MDGRNSKASQKGEFLVGKEDSNKMFLTSKTKHNNTLKKQMKF